MPIDVLDNGLSIPISSTREPFPGDAMPILPEPQVLLTPSPKLPGIDGRKMSKSYGNTIMLTDQMPVVRAKMESMSNGGQRFVQSEPGDPDRCPVGDMHKVFSPADLNKYIRDGCRNASIGCLVCKQLAGDSISELLKPIQSERFRLELNSGQVVEALADGAERARCRAEETMSSVRQAMNLSRNFLGTRVESSLDRGFRAAGLPPVHDLRALKHLWDDDELRPQALRSYWLDKIAPRDIVLKRDSERVFVTWKKKRVYVTTSRENSDGRWGFEAKPKSYEMLALLCWDKELRLHDFIVPQIVYQLPWTAFKKAHKDEVMVFWVRRETSKYFLELPGASPMDITEYRGQYGPMS
jgi:tryptophanyl-tRNA synthetase